MTWVAAIPYWAIFVTIALGTITICLLKYATKLRKQAEPKLSVEFRDEPPFVITEPFHSDKKGWRFVRLKIINNGASHIDQCFVKLEDIKDQAGQSFNFFVPIGLITQHQFLQRRPGGRFNLSPGEHKFVEIACMDESSNNTEIILRYETKEYPAGIPRGQYELFVGVFGGTAAVKCQFQLNSDGGRLQMKELDVQNGAEIP